MSHCHVKMTETFACVKSVCLTFHLSLEELYEGLREWLNPFVHDIVALLCCVFIVQEVNILLLRCKYIQPYIYKIIAQAQMQINAIRSSYKSVRWRIRKLAKNMLRASIRKVEAAVVWTTTLTAQSQNKNKMGVSVWPRKTCGYPLITLCVCFFLVVSFLLSKTNCK